MFIKHASVYVGPDCVLYEASDLGGDRWILWPVRITPNQLVKMYDCGGYEVTLSGKVLNGLVPVFSVFDLQDTGIVDDAGRAVRLNM